MKDEEARKERAYGFQVCFDLVGSLLTNQVEKLDAEIESLRLDISTLGASRRQREKMFALGGRRHELQNFADRVRSVVETKKEESK